MQNSTKTRIGKPGRRTCRHEALQVRYCGSRGRTGQGLIPGVCRNKEEFEEKGRSQKFLGFFPHHLP